MQAKGVLLFFQLIFSYVSIWLSTSWIISLAPYLDKPSQRLIPSFVWPNTTTYLDIGKWATNETMFRNQLWASCDKALTILNVHNDSFSSNASYGNVSYHNNSELSTHAKDLPQYCFTDIASPLFLFFFVLSIIDSAYTIALALVWPPIIWDTFRKPTNNVYSA